MNKTYEINNIVELVIGAINLLIVIPAFIICLVSDKTLTWYLKRNNK